MTKTVEALLRLFEIPVPTYRLVPSFDSTKLKQLVRSFAWRSNRQQLVSCKEVCKAAHFSPSSSRAGSPNLQFATLWLGIFPHQWSWHFSRLLRKRISFRKEEFAVKGAQRSGRGFCNSFGIPNRKLHA